MPSDDDIRRIIQDPSVSGWLRAALSTALDRDPVDAANDAGLLAVVLDKRASDILSAAVIGTLIEKSKNGKGQESTGV